ncbi:unnamed protein product, partial [marine sediment metagenome]
AGWGSDCFYSLDNGLRFTCSAEAYRRRRQAQADVIPFITSLTTAPEKNIQDYE